MKNSAGDLVEQMHERRAIFDKRREMVLYGFRAAVGISEDFGVSGALRLFLRITLL